MLPLSAREGDAEVSVPVPSATVAVGAGS